MDSLWLLEAYPLTMNPYSPEQKYHKYLVEKVLERCKLEQENTEFLIQVKETLMNAIQRGREAPDD